MQMGDLAGVLVIAGGIILATLVSKKLLKLNNPGNPNEKRVPTEGAGLNAGLAPQTTEDWVMAKYPTAQTI